jgi:hypothetical protein
MTGIRCRISGRHRVAHDHEGLQSINLAAKSMRFVVSLAVSAAVVVVSERPRRQALLKSRGAHPVLPL